MWIGLFLFMTYGVIKYNYSFDGGYLFDTFDIESSKFGTALFIISSITAAVFAIKASINDEVEI